MKKFPLNTKEYTYIAIFSVIIAISAWICIPAAPPFTMQIFAVSLCCGILGTKRGVLSLLIYMLLGIIGLPVFSGFRSGGAVLFGATGGYVLGFIPFVALSGYLCKYAKQLWQIILSLFTGLLVCYTFGTLWYSVFYLDGNNIWAAVMYCVIPFIIPDIIKIILAGLSIRKLRQIPLFDFSI